MNLSAPYFHYASDMIFHPGCWKQLEVRCGEWVLLIMCPDLTKGIVIEKDGFFPIDSPDL